MKTHPLPSCQGPRARDATAARSRALRVARRVCLGLLALSLVAGQALAAADWSADLVVRNNVGTPDEGTELDLIIGIDPAASDLYDANIDYAAPPADPNGAVAGFLLNDPGFPAITHLSTDFRGRSTAPVVWWLQTTVPKGGHWAVRWDPAALPATGTFTWQLDDGTGGGTGEMHDMRVDTEIDIPGSPVIAFPYFFLFTYQPPAAETTVTVQSDPPGLEVTLNGATANAPQSDAASPGDALDVPVPPSPQPQGATGTKYVFSHFEDDGGALVAPPSQFPAQDTTYTAVFTPWHQLTIAADPAAGGSVTATPPGQGDPWYAEGTQVTLKATPKGDPCYDFGGWTGDVPAGAEDDPQIVVTMDGPKSLTAHFTPSDSTKWLAVQPTFLDFGCVLLNSSRTYQVTIESIGAGPVEVTDVHTTDPAFTLSTSIPPAVSLAPGESLVVDVTFTPTAAQDYQAELVIDADAHDCPKTVALRGGGSTASLWFPTQPSAAATLAPGSSKVVTLHLEQTGTAQTFEGTFTYDPAVVTVTDVSTTAFTAAGSLVPNWSVAGQVDFSLTVVAGLTGSGPLLDVTFQAVGPSGATTPLDLADCLRNDQPIAECDGELLVAGQSVVVDCRYYRSDLGGGPPPDGTEPSDKPIAGVGLRLVSATTGYDQSATTNNSGQFILESVPPGTDYQLICTADPGYKSAAANTFDALLVQYAVVGLYPGWTAGQEVAGDVSGNGTANTWDAYLIQARRVGLIAEWPAGVDWRFALGTSFFDLSAPLIDLTLDDADGDGLIPLDLRGILLGDANGNCFQ